MDSSATTGRAMSDENVKSQSMFSIFVKTNFTFYDKETYHWNRRFFA